MKSRSKKILTLLLANPLLMLKILSGFLRVKLLPAPRQTVKRFHGVRFSIDPGASLPLKKMAFNAYEPLVVNALKKILKEGDTFIDVGANIGYLSAYGAGLVGKSGQVHSFEPVPRDFQKLCTVKENNPDFNFTLNAFALGDVNTTAKISVSKSWVGWNTLVTIAMPHKDREENVEVPVKRLDEYLELKKSTLGRLRLIKIDVEGYELFVLKGLSGFFAGTEARPLILCEVSPSFFKRLGIPLSELRDTMRSYGYEAFSLLDFKTRVELTHLDISTDVLFQCLP